MSIETKIDMFIGEIRQQNQMRAEEIREIRQKQESDMKEIRTSIGNMQNRIEDMGKHVRNLTVAAMVGMATMTIAGIAVAVSIALK